MVMDDKVNDMVNMVEKVDMVDMVGMVEMEDMVDMGMLWLTNTYIWVMHEYIC